MPDSPAKKVVETHKPIIAHKLNNGPFPSKGFASYYPMMKGDVFFGVLIWVFITWMDEKNSFVRMVSELSAELEETKAQLKSMSGAQYSISNIAGSSEAVVRLRGEIADAARTTSTVLIEGETGVGKELVAHSIHALSARHDKRFVRVNCSAIPANLVESEFFGYDEGAFTGAKRNGKPGKFELADGGSLFLDEINQLPGEIQPKFLRVLQEREIERVGGKDSIPVNVRFIAATNVPLKQLVQQGVFREDLYYRLNVIRIQVPPLRERKDDIPCLVHNLVAKLNHRLGLDVQYVEDDVYEMLMEYDWPGNIRELENVLEVAMNRATEDVLERQYISDLFSNTPQIPISRTMVLPLIGVPLSGIKADMELASLREALIKCKGNKTQAAKLLGISRNAIYKKIKKYDPV